VRVLPVLQSAEMRDAVLAECADADAVIMAAAVADYQPAEAVGQKIKRRQKGLSLSLVRTPDILAEIGRRAGLVKVGFAAESEDLLTNARRKLDEKRLDLIVANNVTAEGSGFGSDTNRVTLVDGEGEEELPLMSKYEVACRVLDRVAAALREASPD
jgi:phosphopantothenoylcysteine decarboxylase/phosphopantothenate--cysteine ligase